jgi:hypothetical protein
VVRAHPTVPAQQQLGLASLLAFESSNVLLGLRFVATKHSIRRSMAANPLTSASAVFWQGLEGVLWVKADGFRPFHQLNHFDSFCPVSTSRYN